MITLAAIADDFTGATDLATTLREQGHRVEVAIGPEGVPSPHEVTASGIDCVIVALKTRTAPVHVAVSQSLTALERLRALSPRQYFVKYCSTFDSTPEGNIGPVLDAITEAVGADRAIVVPSFPDNGRTVYRGHLFVGDDLLSDSSMRHHPLTPMTESRVATVLKPQTIRPVTEVTVDSVWRGAGPLQEILENITSGYVVLDAVTNDDLRTIQAATTQWKVLSGGSGLAMGFNGGKDITNETFPSARGKRLVICGSASATTRSQIDHAAESGARLYQIDPVKASADPEGTASAALDWLTTLNDSEIPVVYSVRTLGDILENTGPDSPAAAIERVYSMLIRRAVIEFGFRQLLVAGGETSGAATSSLGCNRLRVGPQVASGVCWSFATTRDGIDVNLLLKSGNFGQVDLFTRAWGHLPA